MTCEGVGSYHVPRANPLITLPVPAADLFGPFRPPFSDATFVHNFASIYRNVVEYPSNEILLRLSTWSFTRYITIWIAINLIKFTRHLFWFSLKNSIGRFSKFAGIFSNKFATKWWSVAVSSKSRKCNGVQYYNCTPDFGFSPPPLVWCATKICDHDDDDSLGLIAADLVETVSLEWPSQGLAAGA